MRRLNQSLERKHLTNLKKYGRIYSIHMETEIEKYYEDLFSMFTTEGWNILMNTVDENIQNINNVTTIDSQEKLFFAKGQLDVLMTLRNYKTSIEAAYENVQDTE